MPHYVPMGYGPPPEYSAMPPNYGGPGYGPQGQPPWTTPSSNIGWAIAAIFLFWPLCIPAFVTDSN